MRLAFGAWRSHSCRLLTSDQSLITDHLSRVLEFPALPAVSALPALSTGSHLLPSCSVQKHSYGREAHDQGSSPAENLEVQRKRELAHYLSVAGYEHHETHIAGNSSPAHTSEARTDLLNSRHKRIHDGHRPEHPITILCAHGAVGRDSAWIIVSRTRNETGAQ